MRMQANNSNPLLLSFYGDDFTGSTDAMEAMSSAGIETVLFLQTPTPEMMSRFPKVRCVGLAGSSRGRTPEWMEVELKKSFKALMNLGAPILHYKICSTFDSSASIGSIGKAIDIGLSLLPCDWSPMIVGAPRLNRYQIFGNLFAAVKGVGYRLDRHPTMSNHPVTPMHESDLRVHLAQQTKRKIELIDMTALKNKTSQEKLNLLKSREPSVVMIDVLDDETLFESGKLVWENKGTSTFTASSSGLQYALTTYWRRIGLISESNENTPIQYTQPTQQIAVVSGSCSPVSGEQINWARSKNEFIVERLNIEACLNHTTREREIQRVETLATKAIRDKKSPVIFSAEGPSDPAVLSFDTIAVKYGLTKGEASRCIGTCLAQIMKNLLDRESLSRVVIAGGDSSGEVASALEIEALTMKATLTPGAPLCQSWSNNPRRDGLEIVLKGGQMGSVDFYGLAKNGTANL